MKDGIELTKALVPLAWPLILAFVLWRLFPAFKAILNSRSFSVKVAGMEVSVQDATEQIRTQIEDLQKQVLELRRAGTTEIVEAPHSPPDQPKGKYFVLWVDDKPSNNAFEIAQLQEQNVEVISALSTEEAMAVLHNSPRIDAVISDMGRREGGVYRSQAGLMLLNAMRRNGFTLPFLVYSSAKYVGQNQQIVKSAGGDGATASPIELMEWLQSKAGLQELQS
ncbi:hypothetical protein BV96_01114 [Sphingomonas paucimobilis]|nr:hypothetical protein BV96_01114 [Sphingomonas paucimobilis]